jgi:SseB protein N-terminal domain
VAPDNTPSPPDAPHGTPGRQIPGRNIHVRGPDDDGSADPRLAGALDRYGRDPAGAEAAVLTELARARLLVPVVAVLGESEEGPDGLRREKTSDMAVPTLRARGGRVALPAFTCLESLARWRADARPVPVDVRQALEAASYEKADTLLIDIAGPVPFQLTGAAMRALAEGRVPLDPTRDPEVARAVRETVAAHGAVERAHLVPAGPAAGADATLGLVLAPGAPVEETARTVAEALAADETLRARLVRGLELALLPAGAVLPGEPVFAR